MLSSFELFHLRALDAVPLAMGLHFLLQGACPELMGQIDHHQPFPTTGQNSLDSSVCSLARARAQLVPYGMGCPL